MDQYTDQYIYIYIYIYIIEKQKIKNYINVYIQTY